VSNFVYSKTKEAILNGQINFSSDSFKVLILNTNYTANQNSDQFLSDIPSSSIVYSSNNLQNITNTLGVIDGSDIYFNIAANITFSSIVMYKVETLSSNSRLIFYIDSSPGLPYPGSIDGSDVTIAWSNTLNKILSL
jgi:hypothetical protein